MTDELKPCPFCGGEAELQDDLGREDRVFYRAVCGDVGCQGHYCNNWSMTPEEAAGRWNARHERTCRIEWKNEVFAFVCSDCDRMAMMPPGSKPKFCPNCGAKVVAVGDTSSTLA